MKDKKADGAIFIQMHRMSHTGTHKRRKIHPQVLNILLVVDTCMLSRGQTGTDDNNAIS